MPLFSGDYEIAARMAESFPFDIPVGYRVEFLPSSPGEGRG